MPSGYLHSRCATIAAERADIAITNKEAYQLGAHGPDPLFTLGIFPLRPKSKPKPYGKMLHTARTGLFLSALCALAANRSDVEKAFAMGFLTHYALDSAVHPYVNAHSLDAKGEYQSALHTRLENSWDVLYSGRMGMEKTPHSQSEAAVNAKACWEAAAELLSDAARAVYPENLLPAEEFIEAFEGAEKLGRLLRSRSAYCLAFLLERLVRQPMALTAHFMPRAPVQGDIENAARAPWRAILEPECVRDEGLTELFEAAIIRACGLLKASGAFFAGELSADSLAALIGNAGYDTGLESLP